jgi:anti-anti-sigma regulatory factor
LYAARWRVELDLKFMAKSARKNSLRYRIEPQNGINRIRLAGSIDETSDFTELTQVPAPIVIDLSELERINSLGVRAWISFVRDREAAGLSLTFERLPPIVVSQISMISNFMGTRSRITSVFVPYLCTACNHEHTALLDVAPGVVVQPTLPCPKCNSTMLLDELPETYDHVLRAV